MAPDFPGNPRPHTPRVQTSVCTSVALCKMRSSRFSVKIIIRFAFNSFAHRPRTVHLMCKKRTYSILLWITHRHSTISISGYAQLGKELLHQNFALTFLNSLLRLFASTVERAGTIK